MAISVQWQLTLVLRPQPYKYWSLKIHLWQQNKCIKIFSFMLWNHAIPTNPGKWLCMMIASLETQSVKEGPGKKIALMLVVWPVVCYLGISDPCSGWSVWTPFPASFLEALTGTGWVCCSSFPVNSLRVVTATALPLSSLGNSTSLPHHCLGFKKKN